MAVSTLILILYVLGYLLGNLHIYIGQDRIKGEIGGRGALGDHVLSLLEGTTGRMSSLVPGRQAKAEGGAALCRS